MRMSISCEPDSRGAPLNFAEFMEWNKHESNQATFYTGEARSSSRVDAMTDLWELVADEIIPQNEDVDWDYVRAESWADSGRIIVFPASSVVERRIERAGCQVIFSELLSAYNQLADADIDDDTFCEQLTKLQVEWANDLEETAKASKLSNIRISFWDAENEGAFREITLS